METEGVILVEKNIDAKHNQVIDIELVRILSGVYDAPTSQLNFFGYI